MDGEIDDEPRWLGPVGTTVLRRPCGTQVRTTKGRRWSDEAAPEEEAGAVEPD